MSLSDYERRALREVNERKEGQVARSPRTIVPRQVRRRAGDLSAKAGQLPGASKVAEAYTRALQGAATAAAKTSTATLSEDRVLRAFRRRGADVESLEDIRSLDLFVVERRVKLAVQFGGRLTQRKLDQLVPVVGVGAGALLNFKLIDDIAEAAHWAYRERFLLAKHEDASVAPVVPPVPGGPTDGVSEESIDLLGIINAATHPEPGMPRGGLPGPQRTPGRLARPPPNATTDPDRLKADTVWPLAVVYIHARTHPFDLTEF